MDPRQIDRCLKLTRKGDVAAADQLWDHAVRSGDLALQAAAFATAPRPERLEAHLAAIGRAAWPDALEAIGLAEARASLGALERALDIAHEDRRVRLLEAAAAVAAVFRAAVGGWTLADGGQVPPGSSGETTLLVAVRDAGAVAWAAGTGSARSLDPKTVAGWGIPTWSRARPERNAKTLATWAAAGGGERWPIDEDRLPNLQARPRTAELPLYSPLIGGAELYAATGIGEFGALVKYARAASTVEVAAADGLLADAEVTDSAGVSVFKRIAAGTAKPLEHHYTVCTVSLRRQKDSARVAALTGMARPWRLQLETTGAWDLAGIPCAEVAPALELYGEGNEVAAASLDHPSWGAVTDLTIGHHWTRRADVRMPPLLERARLERLRLGHPRLDWLAAVLATSGETLRAVAALDDAVAAAVLSWDGLAQLEDLELPPEAAPPDLLARLPRLRGLQLDAPPTEMDWGALPDTVETLRIGAGTPGLSARAATLPNLREFSSWAGDPEVLLALADAPVLESLQIGEVAAVPATASARPARIWLEDGALSSAALQTLARSGLFAQARWVCIESLGEFDAAALGALFDAAPELVGLRLASTRLDEAAGRVLAAHPVAHQLRRLDLSRSGLKARSIERLAASPIPRWAVLGVRGWKV